MTQLDATYSPDSPQIPGGNALVIGGRQIDGRTAPARRYRTLVSDLARDLGHEPNAGEWLLINRVATLSVQAEMIESDIIGTGAGDTEMYIKITNAIVKLLGSLGLRTRDGKSARTIDAFAEAVMNN